jgi:deoxyribonuclease-4
VDRAKEKGCDAFQIFTSNPRGWRTKPITEEASQSFTTQLKESGLFPVVDHMPYLPNLASPKPDIYEKSVATLTSELHRCAVLGIPYLVTHLGHHLGDGIAGGRARVIQAINTALGDADSATMLLLENTAGEKNSVGSSFEHIRGILDGIEKKDRVGICFDTCHAFAAGYELRTDEGIAETLGQLDDALGLNNLRLIHLNDTKGDRGSGLDRHEHIGLGFIGEEGFRRILHNRIFSRLPLICETPVDDRRDDRGNIEAVWELAW